MRNLEGQVWSILIDFPCLLLDNLVDISEAFSQLSSSLVSLVARAIRNAIRANRFAIETPIFLARQADSPESLEFLIRANHATKLVSFSQF